MIGKKPWTGHQRLTLVSDCFLEAAMLSTCLVMRDVLPLQLKVISSPPGWAAISQLSTTLVLRATVYSTWVRAWHMGGSEVGTEINGDAIHSLSLKMKFRHSREHCILNVVC